MTPVCKQTRTCAAVALTLMASSGLARAQDATAIALDRFEPTPAGDDFLALPDPSVLPGVRTSARLAASYARSPLRLVHRSPASVQSDYVVSHQLTLHVQAAVDLWSTLKLDLDVPFTGSQSGTTPLDSVPSPNGAAMNDVRVGARVPVLERDGLLSGVAVAVDTWWPSGNDKAYAGAGRVRYGGFVLAGGEQGHILWRAMIGRRRNDAWDGQFGLGSDFVFGAGAAWRQGALQIGPELFGGTAVGSQSSAFAQRSSGFEVLAAARYRIGPFVGGLAGGPGFLKAAGTPAWRVVTAIDFAPEVERERGSGALEPAVPAPGAAGSPGPALSAQAPPSQADRDGDGVADANDACPDVAGDASAGAKHPGCPSDRDDDGVWDIDDRCPDQPGVRSVDASRNGCPPDADGDGIVDAQDACPEEAGVKSDDPSKNGCPTAVRVTGSQIVVTQNVNFETGSAVIDPGSEPVLAQVAQVLSEHPEVVRVAVDGHTDNQGQDRTNLVLSRERAVAVVRWLVTHGVDERRLEARGYGQRRPIADNKTPEGRAKNRRVEFLILKRDARGDAAWKDGAVHE